MEESVLEDFRFYPNPVQTNLHVEIPTQFSEVELKIYNQLGQKVLQTDLTSESNTINVSSLSSGIYLLKISTGNHSKTYKFIHS